MIIRLHKRLILLIDLAAIAIVGWAVLNYEARHGWIMLFMLAALTTLLVTRLKLSLLFTGAPFLMVTGMVCGTRHCVLAAAAYALLAAFVLYTTRTGNSRTIWGSVALMICEAFLYSSVYHLLKPLSLFPAIVAMAIVSYLATSLIRNENEGWTERFPLIFNSFIAASCAAFISAFYKEDSLAPLLAAPAVAVIWYWTKIHESRIRAKPADTPL